LRFQNRPILFRPSLVLILFIYTAPEIRVLQFYVKLKNKTSCLVKKILRLLSTIQVYSKMQLHAICVTSTEHANSNLAVVKCELGKG